MASIPPPAAALASGTVLDFTVCAWRDDWRRRSFDEMAQAFHDRRFGDGTRPSPVNFSLYLSNFAYLATPTSNSINKERVAFLGLTGNDPVETLRRNDCDYYRASPRRNQAGELWSFDYRLLELRYSDTQLVALVEAAPGLFQDVTFLHPPEAGFRLFQVVDTSGRQLYESAPDWAWQLDQAGRLDFLLVQTKGSVETSSFQLDAAARLQLIAGGDTPAAEASLRDEAGAGQEVRWNAATSWDRLGSSTQRRAGTRLASGSRRQSGRTCC
jgi:hypothetical protein